MFDTPIDTVTDLVNVERDGNVMQDVMLLSQVLSGARSQSF